MTTNPTSDQLRAIACQARNSSGPSDTTSPSEYVLAGWRAAIEDACTRIKAADDKAMEDDYMLDSDDCIRVLRGTWNADGS